MMSVIGCSKPTVAEKIDDIPINKSVQSSFFGVSFGESRDSVISKFEKRFLIPDSLDRVSGWISFISQKDDYIVFGHMRWESVTVSFRNDKFCRIAFENSYTAKDSAITNYDNISRKVSAKYQLINLEPMLEDGMLLTKMGRSVDTVDVAIFCDSISTTNSFETKLVYGDRKLMNEAEVEL